MMEERWDSNQGPPGTQEAVAPPKGIMAVLVEGGGPQRGKPGKNSRWNQNRNNNRKINIIHVVIRKNKITNKNGSSDISRRYFLIFCRPKILGVLGEYYYYYYYFFSRVCEWDAIDTWQWNHCLDLRLPFPLPLSCLVWPITFLSTATLDLMTPLSSWTVVPWNMVTLARWLWWPVSRVALACPPFPPTTVSWTPVTVK